MLYRPQDWYWKSDAGTVYGSARDATVPSGDETYAAWTAARNNFV